MSAVTDQIDQTFTAMLPAITSAQEQFLASQGMYFQGLDSCSVTPEDGNPAVPDQWDLSPSYQGVSYRQVWGNPPAMQANIRCDQYVGPCGAGWVFWMLVILTGTLWQRAYHHGPEEESWRERDWMAVEEDQ